MPMLTDYSSYADAQRYCSKQRLWQLFDGDRAALNIAHECLDRHPRDRIAVRIALARGGSESFTYGELSDWSDRYANFLRARGIAPGDRVALMVEPSLPFYAALYGAMKAGCVAVPRHGCFARKRRRADCRSHRPGRARSRWWTPARRTSTVQGAMSSCVCTVINTAPRSSASEECGSPGPAPPSSWLLRKR